MDIVNQAVGIIVPYVMAWFSKKASVSQGKAAHKIVAPMMVALGTLLVSNFGGEQYLVGGSETVNGTTTIAIHTVVKNLIQLLPWWKRYLLKLV